MNSSLKHMLRVVFVFFVLTIIYTVILGTVNSRAQNKNDRRVKQTVQVKKEKPVVEQIDWRKSSESKPYPDWTSHPNAWVRVSLKTQRVYIMDGQRQLYKMYASTGSGGSNATPTGTYHIQAERGTFFYNAESGEGARNWVSWKDHGIYLFHSVPTDQANHIIKSQADKLGKSAVSHGCVRLSLPDSKWMYDTIPEGTKVVIDND
ncbi:L,D-transpeptidase [Paucilactobacillus kaifaensis]|uniref:L,D-transpeptidase n=1 Tax=Paucilactobacillus kaifaensis TaxID=2559921 RepID=UPI001CC4198B|nr:L,D-transpeptidase [Paucilactobacillus kaifaensis]